MYTLSEKEGREQRSTFDPTIGGVVPVLLIDNHHLPSGIFCFRSFVFFLRERVDHAGTERIRGNLKGRRDEEFEAFP